MTAYANGDAIPVPDLAYTCEGCGDLVTRDAHTCNPHRKAAAIADEQRRRATRLADHLEDALRHTVPLRAVLDALFDARLDLVDRS